MTKKPRKDDKRTLLIEAFLKLAHRDGVHKITLQMVGKEVGVAYSTVHYYFGNSEDAILNAAFEYANLRSNEFMQDILRQAFSDQEGNAFHRYIMAKFEWSKRFPSFASLLGFFTYLCTRGGKERTLNLKIEQESQAFLRTCLLHEIGKGTYEKPKDLERVLIDVRRILIAEFTLHLTTGKKINVEDLIQEFEEKCIV